MDKDASPVFRCSRKYTLIFSAIGLTLSYYSILVSNAKTADPSYVALCDISETISCLNVFTSYYGKGFGILGHIFGELNPLYQSNGVYGIFFYAGTIAMSLYPAELFLKMQLGAGMISVMISAYLGYILVYVLEELCIVCVSTYILNCLLFIICVRNYGAVERLKASARVSDVRVTKNKPL